MTHDGILRNTTKQHPQTTTTTTTTVPTGTRTRSIIITVLRSSRNNHHREQAGEAMSGPNDNDDNVDDNDDDSDADCWSNSDDTQHPLNHHDTTDDDDNNNNNNNDLDVLRESYNNNNNTNRSSRGTIVTKRKIGISTVLLRNNNRCLDPSNTKSPIGTARQGGRRRRLSVFTGGITNHNNNLYSPKTKDTNNIKTNTSTTTTNESTVQTKEQDRAVLLLKLVVLLLLVLVGTAVATSVYRYTTQRETQNFQDQFTYSAEQIIKKLHTNVHSKLEAIGSLAIQIQSYALTVAATTTTTDSNNTNTSGGNTTTTTTTTSSKPKTNWPYVTVPFFEEHILSTKSLLDVYGVTLFPIVSRDQRESYEQYTIMNSNWINASYDAIQIIQNHGNDSARTTLRPGQSWWDVLWGSDYTHRDPKLSWENGTICNHIFTTVGYNDSTGEVVYGLDPHYDTSTGPYYFPQWQAAPMGVYYQATVNSNYGNFIDFYNSTQISIATHSAVLGMAWQDSLTPGYLTTMIYPIFDTFRSQHKNDNVNTNAELHHSSNTSITDNDDNDRNVVAFLGVDIYWESYLADILPLNALPIHVVVQSYDECEIIFTFQIDGPNGVIFVGDGDLHNLQYNPMMVTTRFGEQLQLPNITIPDYFGIPLYNEFCQYDFFVYPTTSMENTIRTSTPMTYTVTVCIIFLFTIVTFLFYDYLVERRQRTVARSAAVSDSIVSSLFPQTVKNRLYSEKKKQTEELEQNEQLKKKRNQQHKKRIATTTLSSASSSTWFHDTPNTQSNFQRIMGLSNDHMSQNNNNSNSGACNDTNVHENTTTTLAITLSNEERGTGTTKLKGKPFHGIRTRHFNFGLRTNHPTKDNKDGDITTNNNNSHPNTAESATATATATVVPNNSLLEGRAIAEAYPETTVLFADIAGFTKWSSDRDPVDVFTLLECIYGAFDKMAVRRKVFKIETIGDCYVAVTGLPHPQPDHVLIMTRFAKEMLPKLKDELYKMIPILGQETTELAMRVGLHSGPVIAGVLRGEKARFQLFGDTMNTASRMESNGLKEKIHISQATADLLISKGKKHWLIPREDKIIAKGKGLMQTYWIDTSQILGSNGKASSRARSSTSDSTVDPNNDSGANALRSSVHSVASTAIHPINHGGGGGDSFNNSSHQLNFLMDDIGRLQDIDETSRTSVNDYDPNNNSNTIVEEDENKETTPALPRRKFNNPTQATVPQLTPLSSSSSEVSNTKSTGITASVKSTFLLLLSPGQHSRNDDNDEDDDATFFQEAEGASYSENYNTYCADTVHPQHIDIQQKNPNNSVNLDEPSDSNFDETEHSNDATCTFHSDNFRTLQTPDRREIISKGSQLLFQQISFSNHQIGSYDLNVGGGGGCGGVDDRTSSYDSLPSSLSTSCRHIPPALRPVPPAVCPGNTILNNRKYSEERRIEHPKNGGQSAAQQRYGNNLISGVSEGSLDSVNSWINKVTNMFDQTTAMTETGNRATQAEEEV